MTDRAPASPWQDADGGWHIDVRGLPPPQPLVTIVRLLDTLAADGVVVEVRLERDPVMLYPELAQRGWVARRVDGDADEVRLRLTRTG